MTSSFLVIYLVIA